MDETVRAVSVNDVVRQRSNDIAAIFQAFKGGRNTRTPMQRLPRHMRRRAMSYNVKRMPRNWRQYAAQATKKSKHRAKPPSRFYRRRRKFRGDNPNLLRTHVWHAKRYRMNNLRGTEFKVPYECYQKVQRTCMRYAVKECCIVDHSYFQLYKINLGKDENSLIEFFVKSCKMKPTFRIEENRCYEWIMYDINKDQMHNCLGPMLFRTYTEKSEEDKENKFLEISMDPRSSVPFKEYLSREIKEEALIQKPSVARITLYGPKAMKKIIDVFKISKTDDDNLFNYVLDGATILKGVWFSLIGSLRNDVKFPFTLFYRQEEPETIVDMVFDQGFQKDVWLSLVHNRCRPLGLTDEFNVRALYGKFSFPEDYYDFALPEYFSIESNLLKEKESKRPKNRRVKYQALGSYNPFQFDWDNIQRNDDKIIPVRIRPIGKGSLKRFAYIYSTVDYENFSQSKNETEKSEEEEKNESSAPVSKRIRADEDYINLEAPSKFSKIVPMSRLFELEEKRRISRGMKKRKRDKADRQDDAPQLDGEPIIPLGNVIGRVARGFRWNSRYGIMPSLGYCSQTALENELEKPNIVYFRNPASRVYRKARIEIIPMNKRC